MATTTVFMWLGYPLMKNDAPEHQFQKKPVGQHARQEALINIFYQWNLGIPGKSHLAPTSTDLVLTGSRACRVNITRATPSCIGL